MTPESAEGEAGGADCTCGSTTLNHGPEPSCPVHGESVEGEAGDEAVTLWKFKHERYWRNVDHEAYRDHPDAEFRTFVPESSLNAALARAEEAEREQDDWKRRYNDEASHYIRSKRQRYTESWIHRAEEAEAKVERLEALAAGQAATIERVRKWAETTASMRPGSGDFGHGEIEAAREVLSLLSTDSEEG